MYARMWYVYMCVCLSNGKGGRKTPFQILVGGGEIMRISPFIPYCECDFCGTCDNDDSGLSAMHTDIHSSA